MCHRYTIRAILSVTVTVLAAFTASGQVPRPDWRRIGNSALDLSLGGAATGPIDRVWYSEDGATLFARNSAGRTFTTADFESWKAVPAATPIIPPSAEDFSALVRQETRPETYIRVRGQRRASPRLYAIGRFVYKSDDGGRNWANLTRFRDQSILGEGIGDLAVSPRDPDEITVASRTGVWRSMDAGLSWSSLNTSLPNLPVQRILGFPLDTRGVSISAGEGTSTAAYEWMPGEKQAWRGVTDPSLKRDSELRGQASAALGTVISAVAVGGDYVYAGSADGQFWVSQDRAKSWRKIIDAGAAPVEQIFVDPTDPRLALAALGDRLAGSPATQRAAHVIRIQNGGSLWDDLTANLPDLGVHGVTADRATGAVYIATDRGLYLAFEDLVNAAAAAPWSPLNEGLPESPVRDVKLDPAGNQLFAAIDGYGVYAAPAPHRFRAPSIVNAADFTVRAAAPGSLLSVLGANVRVARAGSLNAPVFSATGSKSEIQVPFEARGTSLALALESSGGTITLGVPLQTAAPAILVDRDGTPVVIDADSGVMLDTMTPARSNARLQVLATGLGRVKPDWPTGVPAPADNPPQVTAPVRAWLDRSPVEVTRAVLAPTYVGFYLIEIQLPKLVNYGPAELYVEVDGQPSNRVRVYIEP